MVKLVPGEVYCCDCHHKVMAETKKKQKCNINIINVTKNSDEDKKVNNHIIQVVVRPEHDGGGNDGMQSKTLCQGRIALPLLNLTARYKG